MIALLVFFHSLRSQNYEDRIFMQKMVNQDAAYFIVKPLFLLSPIFTLRIIELVYDLQASLIGIVSQSIFEKRLVKVESLHRELRRVIVFLKETGGQISRLVLLLNKTEHLVDLVGNDVSVLVDLVFRNALLELFSLWVIVLVVLLPLLLSSCFCAFS